MTRARQVSIKFLGLSIAVVQFLFTTLTCLFHKKCNRLKARVVIYAYQHHVRLLSPEPMVVDKPQSTRVEEPTLLCNQVGPGTCWVPQMWPVSSASAAIGVLISYPGVSLTPLGGSTVGEWINPGGITAPDPVHVEGILGIFAIGDLDDERWPELPASIP
jgi:hypothetical protein